MIRRDCFEVPEYVRVLINRGRPEFIKAGDWS